MTRVVAVTGATGRIGRPLVEALCDAGYRVRALSRRSQPDRDGVEWVAGDLLDMQAVASLVEGAATVFHAGGQLDGPPELVQRSLVEGTANVLDAARSARVVHLSSLVVLDTGSPAAPFVIDESSPLEPNPGRRGYYTRGKSDAEALARDAAVGQDVVIVRPGLVMGGTSQPVPLSVGIRAGAGVLFVGPGSAALPTVHANDVASGLVRAADVMQSGAVLHLVDPMPVTRRVLFRRLNTGSTRRPALDVGTVVLRLAGWAARASPGPLSNAGYRILAAGTPHDWSGERAQALGWRPEALRRWLE